MSAKKNWDIRRTEPRTRAPASDPVVSRVQSSSARVHTTHNTRKAPASARRPGTPPVRLASHKQRAPRAPLKERRRRQQRIALIALVVLAIAVVGAALYLLWLPALRIASVSVEGPDAQGVERVAKDTLTGTYWYMFPRNSIFILPAGAIRSRIRDAYPDISAVSLSIKGLDTLSVQTIARVEAFEWCGLSATSTPQSNQCYQSDAEGFLFALGTPPVSSTSTVTSTEASSTVPVDVASSSTDALASDMLRVYAPLATGTNLSGSLLRASVAHADEVPHVLQMVKAIRSVGTNIVSVGIRDDEADLYTSNGVRITYVLGHEQQAAQLAAASLPTLNLKDGSIDYVDLRFEGKVYVKKK